MTHSAPSQPASQARFSLLIPFLGALAALGPLSNDLYVPSLPLVADGLGAGGGPVQLTMSSLMVGFALGALIYGPLSDRYGRKPVLLAGLLVFIVGCVVSAVAGSLEVLIASRTLQGLGASGGMVLSRAIIVDRWSGAEASRAISWVSMFTFLTPVIAPTVGGHVASWGWWPSVFLLQAGAGILCLLVTVTMLPRARRTGGGTLFQSVAGYATILRDRQALGYMSCTGLAFIGVIAFVSNSSFVLTERYGLAPHQYGYCFSLVMLGGSISSYLNGRLVRQLGISRLLGIGTALLALGGVAALAAVALGAGLVGIVVPSMLYVFGVGFVFSNSMARTMSRFRRNTGAASSLFGVNQYLIGAVVAALLSLVDTPTPLPLVGTMAFAGLACTLLWWGWLRRQAQLFPHTADDGVAAADRPAITD